MSMLTKTRKVLTLDYSISKSAVFTARDEDTDAITCEVRLSPADWQDMGRPQTITATIEPSDLLNS